MGIVAHYTFDKGSGATAEDKSSNHNDGKIMGAQWTGPRDTAAALDFDGVHDYVDCGDTASLRVNESLTLTAWVRTTATKQQYIISKGAWSLYLDHLYPHFETRNADNSAWEVDAASPCPVAAGAWAFIVGVYNHITGDKAIYVNGVLKDSKVRAAKSGFGGINRGKLTIGRFSGKAAGFVDGLIGEVRVYDEALSASLIQDLYAAGPLHPMLSPLAYRLSLDAHLFFANRNVTVPLKLVCRAAAPTKARVNLALTTEGGLSLQTQETHLDGTPDFAGEVTFSLASLPPGHYTVRATASAEVQTFLASETADFTLPESPWWLGSKAGKTHQVLAPWRPLEVRSSPGKAKIVACASSRYAFDRGLFPRYIEATGQALLAEPLRLIAQVDGEVQAWQSEPVKILSKTPAKVRLLQSAVSNALSVSVKSRVEYDGMVRIRCKIVPHSPVMLEELTVEIPLRAEHAKYYYYYPDHAKSFVEHTPGALLEDKAMNFNPVIWLGDEERGLEWFCESDSHWHNADPAQAIEIVREGSSVVLRLHWVSRPTLLTEPLAYTFGLQATPVKVSQEDAWDYRTTVADPTGYSFASQLEGVAKQGLRTLVLMDWTDILCYNAPAEPARLRNFVKQCHQHGIQLLVYFGYQMSERAPEFPAFFNDCAQWMQEERYSFEEGPDNYPPKPTQQVFRVCHRSEWRDFVVAGIAKLMDDYQLDGVYLDGTGIPVAACHNDHHGCQKADGTPGGTYPIFAGRALMRRIYQVVKSRKPDGIVNLHNSAYMPAPILAWATSYWDGEQLKKESSLDTVRKRLPLDLFRTEFMGHNWGVPAELLEYSLFTGLETCIQYTQACAIALLHDVPVRANPLSQLALEAQLWRLFDEFGRKEADWLPYWRNTEYVSTDATDTYVSLYKHPTNGVVAVVANLADTPAIGEVTVKVTLDMVKLDLDPTAKVQAHVFAEPAPFSGGVMAIKLSPLALTVVWLK